jgi:hypothetical protein
MGMEGGSRVRVEAARVAIAGEWSLWPEGLRCLPGCASAGSAIARTFGVDGPVQRINVNVNRFLRDSSIRAGEKA